MSDLDGIMIYPHISMDGDALGSSSALCLALRSLGKKAYVMVNEPVPKNLDFLELGCTTTDDSVLEDIQLSLMLDCNGLGRIPGREAAWERGRLKGCIDHHATTSKDIRFDFQSIEPKSAATAEIVYRLIKDLGAEITLDIANCIFTAITTDTGNFQHVNTTNRSHEIVGHLYKVEGFNSKAISAMIYDRKSKGALKLEGYVLSRLHFYADGKIAVGIVSQAMLDEYGCTMDETDGIIQRIMSIDGVEGGCLLKQKGDVTRISLRGRSYINMSRAASVFGGGGHHLASGCTIEADLETAEKTIVPVLISELR